MLIRSSCVALWLLRYDWVMFAVIVTAQGPSAAVHITDHNWRCAHALAGMMYHPGKQITLGHSLSPVLQLGDTYSQTYRQTSIQTMTQAVYI